MKKDKKDKRNKKGVFAGIFGRKRADKTSTRHRGVVDGVLDNSSDSIDDAMLYGRQAAFYGDADDSVQSAPVVSTATDADLGSALSSALRSIVDEDGGAGRAGAAVAKEPELRAAHKEGAAFSESTVTWNTDEELEALLRASSPAIESAAAEEIPEEVTKEDIEVAVFQAKPEEIPPEFMADEPAEAEAAEAGADNSAAGGEPGEAKEAAEDKWAEFYEGLEDMFK